MLILNYKQKKIINYIIFYVILPALLIIMPILSRLIYIVLFIQKRIYIPILNNESKKIKYSNNNNCIFLFYKSKSSSRTVVKLILA